MGFISNLCSHGTGTHRNEGVLAPAEVDRFTGYRYYQVEQIDTMNYIQRLKRYGFSLEEIQQIITLSDEKEISRLLRQQRDKLKREQQEKDTILNELQTHISIFERTGDVMTYQKGYQIEIKNSPAMVLFCCCYWISYISSIHSLRLIAESHSSGMESYP